MHLAVEAELIGIIKFLLENKDIDINITDEILRYYNQIKFKNLFKMIFIIIIFKGSQLIPQQMIK